MSQEEGKKMVSTAVVACYKKSSEIFGQSRSKMERPSREMNPKSFRASLERLKNNTEFTDNYRLSRLFRSVGSWNFNLSPLFRETFSKRTSTTRGGSGAIPLLLALTKVIFIGSVNKNAKPN